MPKKLPAKKQTRKRVVAVDGSWPKDCIQRAFVAGAEWWQFHANGSTAFRSESDQMEQEAIRRYGDPSVEAPLAIEAKRACPDCDKTLVRNLPFAGWWCYTCQKESD